jgi:hypothetical protein
MVTDSLPGSELLAGDLSQHSQQVKFGAHALLVVLQFGALVRAGSKGEHKQTGLTLTAVFGIEAVLYMLLDTPSISVVLMLAVSVLFTLQPVGEAGKFRLNMGTIPMLCVVWLAILSILTQEDLMRSLYGTENLRPYHLIVMFLGSVYLCTALERSGFLHTAAVRVCSCSCVYLILCARLFHTSRNLRVLVGVTFLNCIVVR